MSAICLKQLFQTENKGNHGAGLKKRDTKKPKTGPSLKTFPHFRPMFFWLLFFYGLTAKAAGFNENSFALERSDIGRAIIEEDPEAYLEAQKNLFFSTSQDEIVKIIGAVTEGSSFLETVADTNGREGKRTPARNEIKPGMSIFHLLTRVKTQQAFFAGEILFISAFLSNTLESHYEDLFYWLILNKDMSDKTPTETAKETENFFAAKNLQEMNLMIQKESQKRKPNRQKTASKINYEAGFSFFAGILTITGAVTTSVTPFYEDPSTFAVGLIALSSGLTGAAVICREQFQKQRNQKNKQL